MKLLCLILLFILKLTEGQYGDVRCKCVCPSQSPNSTSINKKIFVKSFHDSRDCRCEEVVDKEAQESRLHFCDRCDCQWQRRNTMTIKIVVIFIICVVAILMMYMGFLICLDPLLPRRDVPYVEQKNEVRNNYSRKVHLDLSCDPNQVGYDEGREGGNVFLRVREKVFGVRDEQARWKDTVQEQRRHIYDHHTMLN